MRSQDSADADGAVRRMRTARGGTREQTLRMSRLLTLSAFAGTSVLDAAVVLAGAWLLWLFAGTNVVDGPLLARAGVFVILTVLIAVRAMCQASALSRTSTYGARLRMHAAQLLAQILVVSAGFAWWATTGDYFIGWAMCFASCYLAAGSFWQVVAVLAENDALPLVLLRLVGAAVGVAGIIATAPIHRWGGGIVESVLVLLSAAILLCSICRFWIAALARVDDIPVATDRGEA